MIANPSV